MPGVGYLQQLPSQSGAEALVLLLPKGLGMPSAPILIVDDDPDTCANCSDILANYGYAVNVAHDGDSALKLARANPYQLALLDFKLPGLNGVELFRALRSSQSGLEGIIITGYPTPEMERDAKALGARFVLSKPVDFAALMPLINRCLDSRTQPERP